MGNRTGEGEAKDLEKVTAEEVAAPPGPETESRVTRSVWVDDEVHYELRRIALENRSTISGEATRLLREAISARRRTTTTVPTE